jgi:heterotetrameric sarcosine oxidase gamma subunit
MESACMPEPIATLLAKSTLPAGGRVISDALRFSVPPQRVVLRLQLGARSQRTVAALRIAGRSVPVAMNSWMGDDPVFMRIAPDTWLVESALHEAADLLAAVRTGCGRRSFAVTEVSDAFATIAVEGALAAAVLVRGCGLDLSPEAFGNAACARTRLAQLPVVLRRVTSERYECLVDRSAAQWLFEWMEDAAEGL